MRKSAGILRALVITLICFFIAAQTVSADVGGICAEGVDLFNHSYTLTGNGASDMVAIAVAQKNRNGDSLGYHTDWGGWCAAFINDCAYLAGQSAAIPFRSGATHDVGLLRRYILNNGGSVVTGPQTGDIVFYHDGSRYFHVGLMMDSSNTIQGNLSNIVKQMTSPFKLDSSGYTVSYVRPAYVNNTKGVLDVNGLLDGVNQPGLMEYGTCDVYINGTLVANDVNDYCAEHPSGTGYRITDIKANNGYYYHGAQNITGTVTSGNTSDVRLQFSCCMLDVNGYLDKQLQGDLGNYGTFDVYINGSLAADDVNDFCQPVTYGAAYRIEDIKASDGHKYDGAYSGSLTGTIGTGRTNVGLSFYTVGTLSGDWIEVDVLPGNVNEEICEIQYKNHYRKTAASSPGAGWVRTGTGAVSYTNSGNVYESDFELSTSDTRVYVGAYYYHYCGASTGVNVEHYNDGVHTDYHVAGDVGSFYVSGGPWTDDNDSRYLAYQIRWTDGEWKDGLATCAGGRSAIWYRRYQYQDRVAVTNYVWEKDSDWVNSRDSSASSVRYRYRLRDVENPVILSAEVTSVTPKDFTVTCSVVDDSGIVKAEFSSWTDTETVTNAAVQEIVMEQTENSAEIIAVIPISAHSNEKDVWYHTQITIYDAVGNSTVYTEDSNTRVYMPTLIRSASRRLVLPAGLSEIEESAFEGSVAVGEAILPEGIRTIGDKAFTECGRLTVVYMPDSITDIGADILKDSNNAVLLCESNNAAAAYARENGLPYFTGGYTL